MNSYNLESTLKISFFTVLIASLLTGCGGGGGGGTPVGQTVSLPLDSQLTLFCPSVGIATEKCILNDPQNPYSISSVNETNKWTLSDSSPSAKSRFYVWGTAMANVPIGENQYYTALSLHQLYTEGKSENARAQAKLAYRSLLDNYFDSLTFFIGNKPLDLLADVDFRFTDWGSGSSLEGNFRQDPGFSPVFQTVAGNSWGAPTAALAFISIAAGTIANYNNLVFKIKGLPTDNVTVKFVTTGDATRELELQFNLTDPTIATDIADKAGWKEVTIPLSNFPHRDTYTEFGIHTGFGNGGSFLITDIAFTGDATGNGLVKDRDNDGFIHLYKTNPGTQQFSTALRNLGGKNLIEPAGSNLLQLYVDESDARAALTGWGYSYDAATDTLTK